MSVKVAPRAQRDLVEIWTWNASERSVAAATRYVDWLKKRIYSLNTTDGRAVAPNPPYRYAVFRRRPKSHGHIAVFAVEGKDVVILRIFHTSQDWENKLR